MTNSSINVWLKKNISNFCAVAELIDNSIQRGETKVELLCAEIDVQFNLRNVTRVNQVAVLDNGNGMTSEILRMALQFGNGTHLDAANQKGIGKFGKSVPSCSAWVTALRWADLKV